MKSAPLSFVIALLSTMIASQPPAPAQQPPTTAELERLLLDSEIAPAIDPEELREALIDFVIRAHGATGNLQYLADVVEKIRGVDRAALVQFIGALPNPEQYLASIRSLGRGRTAAPAPGGPNGPDVPERQRVRADSTRVSSAATALFDPDYAPILNADGSDSTYREVFLNPLFQDGYISSSSANTERCDWNTSADLTRTLTATQIASNIAQAICTIASCDPTGIVCASVCGPYSVAVAALESLQLLGKACEEHEAGVNGAEIQAAYENTKIIAGQVDDVIDTVDQVQSATTSLQSNLSSVTTKVDGIASDLDTHDDAIKDAIANHDAAVTGQIAVHDADIQNAISVHDATVDATIDTHNTTILGAIGAGTVAVTGSLADHFDQLQTFLDQQMALRKVDLDLVEVTKGSPHTGRFMLAATEGGRTVDVEVTRLRVVVERGTDFVDVLADAAITRMDEGLYLIEVAPPNNQEKLDLLELAVEHDDGPVQHFGHGIFPVNG